MHVPPGLVLTCPGSQLLHNKQASSLQSMVCGFHIFVLFYGNFTVDNVPECSAEVVSSI